MKKEKDAGSEMEDIQNMMMHLEDEYRAAKISEKSYKEMKDQYQKKLEEITVKLSSGITSQAPVDAPAAGAGSSEEQEKKGIFKKIFGKKEKKDEVPKQSQPKSEDPPAQESSEPPQEILQAPAQQSESSEENQAAMQDNTWTIELEKIKTIIDTIRETKKGTDETLQNVFEGIGEIRSMVFQTDTSLKEVTSKMERMEDDINEIRPQEISKKFRENASNVEKIDLSIEKLEKKTEDLSEKTNKVYELLKAVGGIENLANINKEMQRKLDDIKDAVKYIERLANKAEKAYIDLSKEMDDIVVYKAKQESLDENVKEILKLIDALNVKIEMYASKKDLDGFRNEDIILQKEIDDIKKILPVAQMSIPEPIANLRKERDDIVLFIESLDEQKKRGKLKVSEYENLKQKNLEKIRDIEKNIAEQWGALEKLQGQIKVTEPPKEEIKEEKAPEDIQKPAPEKNENIKEEIKQEPQQEQKKPDPGPAPTENKPVEIKEKPKRKYTRHKKDAEPLQKVQDANQVSTETVAVKEKPSDTPENSVAQEIKAP